MGTRRLASFVTGVGEAALDRRREEGLELMAIWLNSTYLDRMEWMEELDLEQASDYYSWPKVR